MESAESPEAVIAGQQEEGPGPTSGEAAQVQHNQAEGEAPDQTGGPEPAATPPTEATALEQQEGEPPVISEANQDDQELEQPKEEPTALEADNDTQEPTSEVSQGPGPEEKDGDEEGLPQPQAEGGTEATEEDTEREREEEKQGDPVPGDPEEGGGEGAESLTVQTQAVQPEKKERKKEKDKKAKDKKKDKEKKQKRKSKVDEAGGTSKTRKRSSKPPSGRGSTKQVEAIVLSVFQPFDHDGSGYLDPSVFWEVLQSAELNLQLSVEEVVALQEVIQPDRSGLLPYAEFASQAADIIASLNQNLPDSETNWIELRTADSTVVISFNKKTGEVRDLVEAGVDLFEDIIQDMYRVADSQGKGFVSKEDFTQMLKSEQMVAYLSEEDILQMHQSFDGIPSGQATYADFFPLAKELILRVYRVRDGSDSEWCQLSSPRVGVFWFNKFTGETRRDTEAAPSDEREQEIAFLNQTYAELEATNFELERYKQENRELENQLAQANEEQETLAAQLYETGHALDEATAEIQSKEEDAEGLRGIIAGKDQDIKELRARVSELEKLQEKLGQAEQELQNARETIAARDQRISERDTNISSLQRQTDSITDRMLSVNGVLDARDSSISSLKHQLQSEQEKVKAFEHRVPELEGRLSSLEEELGGTRKSLEEKVQALGQARKHLKNARERNMGLEREMDKLTQTQEKLRSSECEIHTLKSLLTTKTAMVERRKKELTDAKVKMTELEEKDSRRAVILADVLEKTARQYQQQIMTGTTAAGDGMSGVSRTGPGSLHHTLTPISERPASAPPIPPESDPSQPMATTMTSPDRSPPHRIMKSFTLGGKSAPTTANAPGKPAPGKRTRVRGRSKTVPKLPPIRHPPNQRQSFVFSTSHDLRRLYRHEDSTLIDHNPYNPQCNCKLCLMSASIGDAGVGLAAISSVRPDADYTGFATTHTALSGYRSETDRRELVLSQQVRIGQRVLVRMKKSEFDLEPQKLTGIVKYVGKIDSEFIDNKIYVGIKLDEGVGDTDGLIKGKRYFTCPSKHGKLVRISNVIAVLPNKSVFYKPLEDISKRSPYTTLQHKKSSSIRVS